MNKAENVVKYYVLCNKLKDIIRTGWKDWNVQRNRVESVAEHIYGVQMLAIAMNSEYNYEINIEKVIIMLAVHELEEILIGDLTMFQIDKKKKIEKGHIAIQEILSNLFDKEYILKLIYEFDKKESKEAVFAFFCDKLECDLQSKLYDEEKCVDIHNQNFNLKHYTPRVNELLNEHITWGKMWLKFSQEEYNYDKNFMEVSDYAMRNNISEFRNKENGEK